MVIGKVKGQEIVIQMNYSRLYVFLELNAK